MGDDERMKMHTNNLVDEKYFVISTNFPNAVTETIDENGEVVRAIDSDILEQEINARVVSGRDERYQFTWPDKKKAVLLANSPINATLRPCREESVDFDNTENIYVEGDNLDALKLLRETYLNRVKMIYIDPPYNTSNDFIYNDDFSESVDGFLNRDGQFDEQGNRLAKNLDSNGRFHTDWLNMIYPRLKIAKDLLSEDGVIYISIDDNEIDNLKKCCDEILGRSNFVGTIAWESKTKSQNTLTAYNKLQPKIEYILLYTKGSKRRFNLLKRGEKEYKELDERGEYRWFKMEPMNASGIRGRETMIYSILGVLPPAGKQWQIGVDMVNRLLQQNDVKIVNGLPYIKLRPEDERKEITEPFWGFFSKEIGTAESAKKELSSCVEKHGFETVKPTELIKRILFHSTDKNGNDIILDFFSGSATTAHAAMQLNAEDDGNRKYIMVQLPELTDEKSEAYKAGYKTICEIGKERIRRAGAKIKEDNKGIEGIENLDVGFRVLKLDSSNMKDVYYTPEEYAKMNFSIDGFMDNIKPDRTDEDLLFQVMLDLGIPLSAKISQKEGVFYVNNNYMIASFGKVDNSLVTEIAKKQPYYAVFRDSSFINDSALVNVEQIFNTYSPNTIRRVL